MLFYLFSSEINSSRAHDGNNIDLGSVSNNKNRLSNIYNKEEQ